MAEAGGGTAAGGLVPFPGACARWPPRPGAGCVPATALAWTTVDGTDSVGTRSTRSKADARRAWPSAAGSSVSDSEGGTACALALAMAKPAVPLATPPLTLALPLMPDDDLVLALGGLLGGDARSDVPVSAVTCASGAAATGTADGSTATPGSARASAVAAGAATGAASACVGAAAGGVGVAVARAGAAAVPTKGSALTLMAVCGVPAAVAMSTSDGALDAGMGRAGALALPVLPAMTASSLAGTAVVAAVDEEGTAPASANVGASTRGADSDRTTAGASAWESSVGDGNTPASAVASVADGGGDSEDGDVARARDGRRRDAVIFHRGTESQLCSRSAHGGAPACPSKSRFHYSYSLQASACRSLSSRLSLSLSPPPLPLLLFFFVSLPRSPLRVTPPNRAFSPLRAAHDAHPS